jgi:hypothetical protein
VAVILYTVTPYSGYLSLMNADSKNEEIRWQVTKAMLDEFPTLKEKARRYLRENRGKRPK